MWCSIALNDLIRYVGLFAVWYIGVIVQPSAIGGESNFAIGDTNFLLDRKTFQIKTGEIHPSLIPHQYWDDRLRIIHAMGSNMVSIYVFWNVQEPREGEFNFKGDADIAEFVRLAQKEGLWVILRPESLMVAPLCVLATAIGVKAENFGIKFLGDTTSTNWSGPAAWNNFDPNNSGKLVSVLGTTTFETNTKAITKAVLTK